MKENNINKFCALPDRYCVLACGDFRKQGAWIKISLSKN